jgi:hypothetical protein
MPTGPAAKSRRLNHFFFQRIIQAAKLGDFSKIVETAELGVALNTDHRKAVGERSRQRQLETIHPLYLICEEQSPDISSRLTVDEVQKACIAEGREFDARTIRKVLDDLGMLKPDKPGPKRKR